MKPSSLAPHAFALAVTAATLALACSSSSSNGGSAETTTSKVESARADVVKRLDLSAMVVTDISSKVPEDVASRTRCLVVAPNLVKGGVVIGAESGKGFATCQTANGWSPPAPISVGGATLGAQIGVQSTDVIGIVTSDRAMKSLESGTFRVGVDASATAGPVGTGRGATRETETSADVLTYSRSEGLFAGANLSGSEINADADATRALYGASYDMGTILEGRVSMPADPAAERFHSAVQASFGKRGVAAR